MQARCHKGRRKKGRWGRLRNSFDMYHLLNIKVPLSTYLSFISLLSFFLLAWSSKAYLRIISKILFSSLTTSACLISRSHTSILSLTPSLSHSLPANLARSIQKKKDAPPEGNEKMRKISTKYHTDDADECPAHHIKTPAMQQRTLTSKPDPFGKPPVRFIIPFARY